MPPNGGNVEIAGKVVETSVSGVFKCVYNGSPVTLTYKGALGTDGHIAGAVTAEEFNVTGEVTATPAARSPRWTNGRRVRGASFGPALCVRVPPRGLTTATL